MSSLEINGIPIQDDYSETFNARLARILVTSTNRRWALEAALETKGLGRSATAPPCEATLEGELEADETPDGRPGFVVQVMDRKLEDLRKCLALRIRKGALPNPKTSVFDALPIELAEETLDLEGTIIQKFGDGYEEEIEACGRTLFRIPRLDGWFHVERRFGIVEAVTGGMFLILADSNESALAAAEVALEAVARVPLVIVKCASSGSKVGAKSYTDVVATTNDAYCPTLGGLPDNRVPDGVECVYEIIVSGPKMEQVRQGMRVGIESATTIPGVKEIHTANYGGKLGKGKIYLHSLFEA